MDRNIEFITNVINPWDELNQLLAQPYAFEPMLSSITRLTNGIANNLKNQVDIEAHERAAKDGLARAPVKMIQKEVDSASNAARLMSDIADKSKHVVLDHPSRMSTTSVYAGFEASSTGFRFIKNTVVIAHASLGEFDFLKSARDAIDYWIVRRQLTIHWPDNAIREGEPTFQEKAILYFNPKYCVRMETTQVRFFQRDSEGLLHAFAPPSVTLEIH